MIRNEESSDLVVRLALRIARRADELAHRSSGDLEAWLQAEEEILGRRLPDPALHAASRGQARRDDSAMLSPT